MAVLSLIRLNIQHKNIIHSILVCYKTQTQASALSLIINFSIWLDTFFSKGSKITYLRQGTMKALKIIWDFSAPNLFIFQSLSSFVFTARKYCFHNSWFCLPSHEIPYFVPPLPNGILGPSLLCCRKTKLLPAVKGSIRKRVNHEKVENWNKTINGGFRIILSGNHHNN